MKIRDLLINEYQTGNIGLPGRVTQPGPAQAAPAPTGIQPGQNARDDLLARQGATPAPKPAPKTAAKKDPAVLARQQELINAGAKIKADGIMGPQTRQAEKDFGAKVDALKAANQAGPTTVTNPAQATQAAPAPAANQGGPTTVTNPAQATQAAAPAQPGNTDPGQGKVDYSLAGGRAQTAPVFGQPAPAADNPNPPAAAPAQQNTAAPASSGGYAQSATAAPAPDTAQQNTAAPASSGGYAQSATAAPAAAATPTVPNPWDGKDPAKAAAWAKLSPEDQQWLGMADPTDKAILSRAPSNGGFWGSLGFGKKKEESITQVVAERNQTYKKDNELLQRMRQIAGLR